MCAACITTAFFTYKSRSQPSYHGRALSAWLVDVRSSNASARSDSAQAVRKLDESAVPYLIAELNHRDGFLKSKLLIARKTFPSLLGSVRPAQDHHSDAVAALILLRPLSPNAIKALSPHLLSTNAGVAAFKALIPPRNDYPLRVELAEPLVLALKSADRRVRFNAAAAMQRLPLDHPLAVAALQQSLSDADTGCRKIAALSLTKICSDPAILVSAHVTFFGTGDVGAQHLALRALAQLGTNAAPAIPLLLGVAKAESTELRRLAVSALGQIHSEGERVIPILIARLEDNDPHVRKNAAVALEAYGGQATNAIPVLLKADADNDRSAGDAATRALNVISKLVQRSPSP